MSTRSTGTASPSRAPPPAEAEVRNHASSVRGAEWTSAFSVTTGLFEGEASVLAGTYMRTPASIGADVPRANKEAELGTLIMVWTTGDWFVKLRGTWLDTRRAPDQVVNEVLGWSVLPCAILRDTDPAAPIKDMTGSDLPPERYY